MEEIEKPKNLSHREWVDHLASYFKDIKESEEKIESSRITLNQQENFTSKALFDYIDKDKKNFITLDDLIKFCQENSIKYNEKFLRQFIHNYDKDNDFKLNLQEFQGIIYPLTDDSYKKLDEEKLEKERLEKEEKEKKEKEERERLEKEKAEKEKEKLKNNNKGKKADENLISTKIEENHEEKEDEKSKEDNDNEKKDENNEDNTKEGEKEKENEDGKDSNINNNVKEKPEEEKLDPNILSTFGEILNEEMSLAEKNLENAKKISGSKNFTFYESFLEIADEDKYITEDNLKNFLKKNGVEIDDKDAKGLIHRNDTDNDGKISFPEYHEIFYPPNESPYKSSYNNYKSSYNNYDPIYSNYKPSYNNINNSSSYYPLRNINYKPSYDNYNSNSYYNYKGPSSYKDDFYQTPKLKSSPLNYNYSTYPDDDNNYNSKPKYRNSSMINLKDNYPNSSLKNNSRYSNGLNECNDENENKSLSNPLYRSCCGCPENSIIVHCCGCCCCICCPDC